MEQLDPGKPGKILQSKFRIFRPRIFCKMPQIFLTILFLKRDFFHKMEIFCEYSRYNKKSKKFKFIMIKILVSVENEGFKNSFSDH
jgi:hypothetical protein